MIHREWSQLSAEIDRRLLDRVKNSRELSLKVQLIQSTSLSLSAELLDFTATSARLSILSELDGVPVPHRLIVMLGKAKLGEIEGLDVVRWDPKDKELVVAFDQGKVRKGARKTPRIRIRSDGVWKLQMTAKDPMFPTEFLYFSILDAHSSGMRLETSLRNKHLLQGALLKGCTILFPRAETLRFTCQVRNIHHKNGRLHLGVEFSKPNQELLDCLGQIGLLLHEVPPDNRIKDIVEELESAGFSRKRISRAFRLDIISTPVDYQKILELRLKAYEAVGKLKPGTTHLHMADEFDQRATIIGLRLNGEIVATVRLIRAHAPQDIFPFEEYGLNYKIPPKVRLVSCEISRMAVDPEVKGTDLPASLVKFLFDLSLRAQFHYLYCLSTTVLQPVYRRFGFKNVSDFVDHPVLEHSKMGLMIAYPQQLIKGRGVSALVWDHMYKDVITELDAMGMLPHRPNRRWLQLKKRFEQNLLKLRAIFVKRKPKA